MVCNITVLNSTSCISAPLGQHPGQSLLGGAGLPFFLFNLWLGEHGRLVVPACGWLDKWLCTCSAGPVSPLLTPPCGWACESNNFSLGWVVEACTSTPRWIWFSSNPTFIKVYIGYQEVLYLWKQWHFSLYYPLSMFPMGQNQKEQESWIATRTFNNWEFLETRFWKYSLLTLKWHQVKGT